MRYNRNCAGFIVYGGPENNRARSNNNSTHVTSFLTVRFLYPAPPARELTLPLQIRDKMAAIRISIIGYSRARRLLRTRFRGNNNNNKFIDNAVKTLKTIRLLIQPPPPAPTRLPLRLLPLHTRSSSGQCFHGGVRLREHWRHLPPGRHLFWYL